MAELHRRLRRVPVAEIPVVGIPAAAKTAARLQVPQKAKVPRGASGLPAWASNWRFARAGSRAARPTRSQTAPRRMKTHDKRRTTTMFPWNRGPIYEPKDSRFRPWNVSTLLAFLFGRMLGRWFRKK